MGLPRSNWAHRALRQAPLPSEPSHLALNLSFSKGVLPTRDRFSFPSHFPGVPSPCTTRTAARVYQCFWTEHACNLKCCKTLWLPQCFRQHIIYLAFVVLFLYFVVPRSTTVEGTWWAPLQALKKRLNRLLLYPPYYTIHRDLLGIIYSFLTIKLFYLFIFKGHYEITGLKNVSQWFC